MGHAKVPTTTPFRRPALLVLLAFAAVYLIWGSTYLAIRIAVETLPPFLMAGARWLVAGAALLAWRLAKGDGRPTARQWGSAAIVGALLIVGGNGLVSFAEQTVESNLAALLIAIVPLFIALLAWATGGGTPRVRAFAGILLGLAGVGVLVAPAMTGGGTAAGAPAGIALILLAAFSWSAGSLYSRRAPLPKSPLLGAAMQMVAGGALLLVLGLATGEPARLDLAGVTWEAWTALAFLVLFGSIVAYSAYVWLLQVSRPELVATYAFVNPVVAVALGLLWGEAASPTTLPAAALIVVAIALVVTAPKPGVPRVSGAAAE